MQFIVRNKKQVFLVLKIVALVFAIYYIKRKLFDSGQFDELMNYKSIINGKTIKIFLLILVLMPINWLIESVKWKYLVFQTQNLSVKESFVSILKGVYLSMITPNRIGEGLGKVEGLKRKSRSRGAYAFFIGSMSQLLVTSLVGTIALWMTEKNYLFDRDFWFLFKVGISAITALILIAYYYPKWRDVFAKYISLVFNKSAEIKFSPHQLNNILTLSIMRYVIFATQFYLALLIFDFNLSIIICFISIAITYLFSTWIPSFLMGDLGIREGVALAVFGMFTSSQLEIVFLASLIVWIVNLLLPALAGMVLFTFVKKKSS